MRLPPLVLFLALLALPTALLPATSASAATPELPVLQQALTDAAKSATITGKATRSGKRAKVRRGKVRGRKNARAAKLTREVIAFAQARVAAGQPIFETAPATRSAQGSVAGSVGRSGMAVRARAAHAGGGNATVTNAPPSFGTQVSTSVDAAGNLTAEFDGGDVTLQMGVEKDEFSVDIRDRSGAGGFATLNLSQASTPRCPTSAGDVPSEFDLRMTIGQAEIHDGLRYVTAVTMDMDGPWHGYVGVGGRSERFDVSVRSALEVRVSVEDPKTRKVLHREGTRTYRAVLDRKGLPIGTPGRSVAGGARLFGPKGAIRSSLDRKLSASLSTIVAQQVDLISDALKDGDERWYEQRRCARTFKASALPSEVVRGDTASWKVRVISDLDGLPAADAIWSPTSTCGVVRGESTRGAIMSASVVDSARAWSPKPYAPACLAAEVTSTAGRAATWSDTIEPKKPDGLRFTFAVTYNETMGSNIAETNMTGIGTVFLPWDATDAEGSGTYEGTEWDGTPANSCGMDMSRARGFAGKATVGVHRNDDDTFSLVLTANERPLRMSFLAIVPAEGGLRDTTGTQPFCGARHGAKTTTKVTVSAEAVPAP